MTDDVSSKTLELLGSESQISTGSPEPRCTQTACDWKTSLDDLSKAVSGRVELVLVMYTVIAYAFTWILGWVYVLDLQYKTASPPLILVGIGAFGPTVSAFITMGLLHRKLAHAYMRADAAVTPQLTAYLNIANAAFTH